MIKFYKLIIIFFFLVACGYQPIFYGKKINFKIGDIKYDKNNKIDSKIYKILNKYNNLENKNNIFDLEITSIKNKIVTSKDGRGDPKNFRLGIEVNLKIIKNDKLIYSKNINKSHDYENSSKKFELKKYENLITENFIDKISEEIIIYILSLED
jgi:outer membrane lipopolysaccharide assembly protein LptE/RlpB